jgi:triphosphoribosyl-dephospho-CoA synthase
MTLRHRIAAAFVAACRTELAALKPGNVHVFADGHRMTAQQFVASAEAAAAPLTEPGASVGARILGAVAATAAAVGTNTNLGIVLLCAPLAAAAEHRSIVRKTEHRLSEENATKHEQPPDLAASVAARLDDLDIEDARLAFAAIVRAAPGGLGRTTEHDVHAPPTASLRAAMAAAADRDAIARQYATGFADVFGLGMAALEAARARGFAPPAAALAVYLAFLAAMPDTHVVRKHGLAVGEDVRRVAASLRDRLATVADPSHLHADLLAWDAALKARGINPGTSADLTVATLFASSLRHGLPPARNSG